MSTNLAIDLRMLQATTLLDTDPAAAAREALGILEANPGHVAATLLLSTAYQNAGNTQAAMSVLTAFAAIHTDSAVIQLELGRAARAANRLQQSLAALERAAQLQPDLAEAWKELSWLHAARGEPLECDAAYARFIQLAPQGQHLGEAARAIAVRRFAAAEAMLQRQLAAMPADVEAMRMLAQIATEREDYPEAVRLLEECLRIAPGSSSARFDLAVVLHFRQTPAPVLPLLDRLLAQDPRNFQYRSLQASALTTLGQPQRSAQILAELLAEFPNRANVWLNYGHALRADGRQADAIVAYRKSIEHQPDFGEAYFSLANLKTFQFTPDEIAAMHAQLQREDLADADRLHFEFACGKSAEDAGSYEEAFAHYARGNSIRRAGLNYDPQLPDNQIRRTRKLLTTHFFAARRTWGSPAADPIFIVGLPRSGSTLLEQILASHSQVEGTRELADVPGFAYELGARKLAPGQVGFPESLARLSAEQLLRFGERYLEQTRPYRLRGTPHFIDKMPNNFINIGLIHLMLPQARIIDARRHPLACCFSNFKQHFQKGLHYTYSLEEIGRFCRGYFELMAHFDEVLPGRIHRVHYEHLIANPEREVRLLLDYCGLPFEEGCLRFHENRRVVMTASSEQVRRPLNTEGLDQWRHFEPWLGPLKEALGDLVDNYPAPAA